MSNKMSKKYGPSVTVTRKLGNGSSFIEYEKWPRRIMVGDRVQDPKTGRLGTVVFTDSTSGPSGIRFDGEPRDIYIGSSALKFLGDE